MLPEGRRLYPGIVATALSLAGLAWSIGFAPAVPTHLGFAALFILMMVGGAASLVVRLLRERGFELAIIETADAVGNYANRIAAEAKSKDIHPNLLRTLSTDWSTRSSSIITQLENVQRESFAKYVILTINNLAKK